MNNFNTRKYNSPNNTARISISSFNSSDSNSGLVYKFIKKHLESNLSSYKVNQNKYNGTIYNSSGKYTVVIFNDSNKNIVTIHSKNLDTAIHMAQTFKLLKEPVPITNNTTPTQSFNVKNNNNSNNSSDFDPYDYWDNYYNYYNDYYDDYYYNDYSYQSLLIAMKFYN